VKVSTDYIESIVQNFNDLDGRGRGAGGKRRKLRQLPGNRRMST